MVCPDCGTRLTDADQFCPGCGAKIIRKRRCPACGEGMREGVRFCPKCGAAVEESQNAVKKRQTEAPLRKASPAPPPKAAKRRQDEDWDDYEEYDYEDDYDDEEDEEGADALSILTVAAGCILLVVAAFLGYQMFQRYAPKNYDKIAAEHKQEEGDPAGSQELTKQPQEETKAQTSGSLVIAKNVNIRDNPSTEGSKVIRVAKAGESYEYTELAGGGSWYRILLPDDAGYEYGYVYGEYVTIP